jgi:O-antigen chain-terminating methyltransferase
MNESGLDTFYHRFEDLYRGSSQEILSRHQRYRELLDLPALRQIGSAIDLGAGRGEFVQFLVDNGFEAYGVDSNDALARAAAERGAEVRVADLIDHLQSLAHNSAGLISMLHVAEHLPFETLVRVIRLAGLVLARGGALLIETPNPTNLRVGAADFYLDPTHLRPLHPMLVRFLFSESGLIDVRTHYLDNGGQGPHLETPLALRDEGGERLIELLNQYLLSPLDYAVIGYKP